MPNAAADRHRAADRPAPVGFAPRAGRGGLNKNASKRGREVRTATREVGMRYFVTGATGFIGKRLVKALLARRGAVVHFLLRPESEGKVAALLGYWGEEPASKRVVPVYGDLTAKKLGVSADAVKKLKG